MRWQHSRCSLSVSWRAEWVRKKEMKCGTYRLLFQKNEANHDNVYITSNGPIFKEAGNLLKQIEIRENFFNFQNCKGRSIGHIYEQVCIDLTKYIYVGSQFPSNLIFFNKIRWLHLLFNSRTGMPWFWAVWGKQRAGSWLSPYHVHDREDVRGDVGLGVFLHHFLVCYHKGFHVEALVWLASWSSGPSRAPIFIKPEIGVLCGRLGGIYKEQESIWKGWQQRSAGETDRHLNKGRRETK